MKILITGSSGYLGQAIIKRLEEEKIEYLIFDDALNTSLGKLIPKYMDQQFTHIYHLASPSTSEDFTIGKVEMYKAIVKGTMNMIELSNQINTQFVYFSTEGILTDLDSANDYCKFKKLATDMVRYISNSFKILIVPRVYSADRKKGVIAKLRDGKVPSEDMSKEVDYLELSEFINQFFDIMHNEYERGIYYFHDKIHNTLQELKDKYISM